MLFDYLFIISLGCVVGHDRSVFCLFFMAHGVSQSIYSCFLIHTHGTDSQITFKICHHSISALEAVEVEYVYQSSCSGLELMLTDPKLGHGHSKGYFIIYLPTHVQSRVNWNSWK